MSEDDNTRRQQVQVHARSRFLAQSIQLEEGDVPGVVSGTVLVTALLFVSAIVWAGVTRVAEVTVAPGEVVPAGLNHQIQHLEGGLIENILVRNGDKVAVGQALVRISSTIPDSQLANVRVREANLALRLERLSALLENRNPDFAPWQTDFPDLVDAQATAYQAQKDSLQGQTTAAQAQIAQRRDTLVQLQNEHRDRAEEVAVLREQYEMRERVARQGTVSRDEVLGLHARLLAKETELGHAKDGIAVARAAQAEAQARRAELTSRFHEALQIEASEVAAERAELSNELRQVDDRVRRTEVVAPVGGIVNNLLVNTIGSVVRPGETILEIVPLGDGLIVDARITPDDIGHVRIGQPVDVQISAYDTARYGTADGELRHLSASTYLDEQAQPYYRAEIRLGESALRRGEDLFPVIPGMTVTAQIVTGEKSILDYLLKPVYRGFQDAFHEQ